jgi:methionine-rich copper-binding protein CopC
MIVARRALEGLAGAGAALALCAGPAAAHDELIGSIPEDGSTVATTPEVVELAFDQPVQREFDQLAVLDEDDVHHEEGEVEIVGGRVRQPVGELEPGRYRITYRIVSADGHPVTGTVTFNFSSDGPFPTAAPQPSASETDQGHHEAAAATTADGDDELNPLLLTAGGIAAAGVLGAVVFFAMGGRRPPGSSSGDEAETAH